LDPHQDRVAMNWQERGGISSVVDPHWFSIGFGSRSFDFWWPKIVNFTVEKKIRIYL
jgi:hypothetical protein